ncbi:MAG: hypothetical protein KKD33_09405, partial [Verrucomicrobia bacterium]|nr:hypothetical protein [Verrucomicrobiota bacterium]
FCLKPKDSKPQPGEEMLTPEEAKFLQRERPAVKPGDDLVPAAGFDRCEGTVGCFGRHFPDAVNYRLNFQPGELFPLWPAKLCFDDPFLCEAALRAYRNRCYKHHLDGWNLDVVFAANLGLIDEVKQWFGEHFNHTHVFACGLAQEASTKQADTGGAIPLYPSCQGLGTSVIPVIDQLLRDRPDGIEILPCWPCDVGIYFVLYHPIAGRVEVDFEPTKRLVVKTSRTVSISMPDRLYGLFNRSMKKSRQLSKTKK